MSLRMLAGRALFASCQIALILVLDASLASAREPAEDGPNDSGTARLVLAGHRYALARAIQSAARQLAEPACQGMLDEFQDAAGRPLRAVLAEQDVDFSGYLGRVFFYDAPEWACRGANLAVTKPGSRAVFVCGSRFQKEMARDSRNAEAIVIHELLHSLGLGENPPSSDFITARVRARCGEAKTLARAGSPK